MLEITVQHPATKLCFILHVTHFYYTPGCPATGPTYSCGGTPPEPAEAYAEEGYVTFDGEVHEIESITSAEMDVIMQMTNDNQALFDVLCEENDDAIYNAIVTHVEDEEAEAMCASYSARETGF